MNYQQFPAPKKLKMKYLLYEHSVQTPVLHCKMFSSMFEEIRGKPPLHLREDFCGTFLLSSTWVQQKNERTAFGLDIDPEPLAYGKKRNSSQLSAQQRKRLIILQRDVLKPTSFPIDLVVACNFSFNTFKTRPLLGHYFRSVLQSLPSHGLFLLEMAGGPGMITESKEQKTLYLTPKKSLPTCGIKNHLILSPMKPIIVFILKCLTVNG